MKSLRHEPNPRVRHERVQHAPVKPLVLADVVVGVVGVRYPGEYLPDDLDIRGDVPGRERPVEPFELVELEIGVGKPEIVPYETVMQTAPHFLVRYAQGIRRPRSEHTGTLDREVPRLEHDRTQIDSVHVETVHDLAPDLQVFQVRQAEPFPAPVHELREERRGHGGKPGVSVRFFLEKKFRSPNGL